MNAKRNKGSFAAQICSSLPRWRTLQPRAVRFPRLLSNVFSNTDMGFVTHDQEILDHQVSPRWAKNVWRL